MTWRRQSTYIDDLTLEQVKNYLRVNHFEDDDFILTLINVSLEWVTIQRQRPVLATSYTDSFGRFDDFPTELVVGNTEPPVIQPTVFYTNTSGTQVEYPAADVTYDYDSGTRQLCLEFATQPDIQADSLIQVNWAVNAVGPYAARDGRLLVIGNWYENREASVSGTSSELRFGVTALVSPDSLVI